MSDALTQTAAKLVDIYLHRARFRDNRTSRTFVEGLDSRLLLSASLLDDRSVGVEFGVACRTQDESLVFQVVYRMEFARGPGTPDDVSDEQFARDVAAQIAPVVGFPFVRETIASLTGKSGEPILLPVLNVGSAFKPGDLTIGGVRPKPAPPAAEVPTSPRKASGASRKPAPKRNKKKQT